MTLRSVNWTLTQQPDPDLKRAHEQLARIQAESKSVIRIMTAEQAVLALKIMREAGRRGR